MNNAEDSQLNNQSQDAEDHNQNVENQDYDEENQMNNEYEEDEQNEKNEHAEDVHSKSENIEKLGENIFEEEGRVLSNSNNQDTKENQNLNGDENLKTEKFNSAMEGYESFQETVEEVDNMPKISDLEIESLQMQIKTLK